MKTKKKLVLSSLILFITIICLQNAFALTANSSNYSVGMFGTGMAAANSSSANYETESISVSQPGTRNAESDSHTVNIGFFNNTSPYATVSITSYSISPTSAVVGSTIGLYISALNPQSVWAKITSPNSQEQTVTLVNEQTVNYVPSPSVVGTYTVTFYANSSTGAVASIVDSFALTAQTTTTPQRSGGSGSRTTTEECTYLWDCTPWVICAEGKQKRICTNTGTCNGTEGKPVEEMVCSKDLFDITLELKEIELSENKTLKFSIDLTEKIGVDKIDVCIKYLIINKEGYEIFRQVETKAVQEVLSYEKEIEEIKLVDGEYTIKTEIFYGYQQRAFAEQKIKIVNGIIKIEEPKSNLRKIIEFFSNYGIILIGIIIGVCSVCCFKKGKHHKRFSKKKKSKKKHLIFSLLVLSIFALFAIILGTNITGNITKNLSESNWRLILIPLITIFLIVLLIAIRKKLVLVGGKIIQFFSEGVRSSNKYPRNSIKGLINKKVYSDGGNYIGKVVEVVLGENKIDSLKIKLAKKKKIRTKGVIVKYNNVKSVGEIVIVDENILKKLGNT